jgi:RAD51-like protein 2
VAAVQTLATLLDRHTQVRLVVVDSVAFHFRHDFADYAARSRIMASMANTLTQLARTRKIAGLKLPASPANPPQNTDKQPLQLTYPFPRHCHVLTPPPPPQWR